MIISVLNDLPLHTKKNQIEFLARRSAKGFRVGFNGFESSMFLLERFGKMYRIKWGLRERSRNDGLCLYLEDLRTVHRNQAMALFLTGFGMNGGAARQNFPHLAQGLSPARKALESRRKPSPSCPTVNDGSHPLTSILDTETDGPYRPTAERRSLRLCSTIKSMRASPLGCQFEGLMD
jgi:hypothetical protein